MWLLEGLFFFPRHNEYAIMGTLKSSHIWAFNAMLIMGLSKTSHLILLEC